MTKLTAEVKSIFEDDDINLGHSLKHLAECFGKDATLETVYDIYCSYKLPTKMVNCLKYVAGYKGANRVPDGWTMQACLIDVVQSGKVCKLMFGVGNKYLYHTLDEYSVSDVIGFTKQINSEFDILVISEKIEATGEYHAIVDKFVQHSASSTIDIRNIILPNMMAAKGI